MNNPQLIIKYTDTEPPYIEISTEDGALIVHGWVHDDPWPSYDLEAIEDDEEEEEEEEEEEDRRVYAENSCGRILFKPQEIIDPPLYDYNATDAIAEEVDS